MKKIFKKLLLLTLILISVNYTYAQDAEKTITLVVNGQGKTKDEAKQNALRSAIEQAFGVFISSKTEILNDNLIKDEIVSLANGNIQKYEVISEVSLPDNGYATTLNATVSVAKLISFVESKGFAVEFKGSLFGANMRLQSMNELSELKSILILCESTDKILSKSLDYKIIVEEPKKTVAIDRNFNPKSDEYFIPITVKVSTNDNFNTFLDYFFKNIKSLSMSANEINDYKKINKKFFIFQMENPKTVKSEFFYFRNPETVLAIQNLFLKSNQYIHNFIVVTNIDTINVNRFFSTNRFNNWDVGYNNWVFNVNDALMDYDFTNKSSYPSFYFKETKFVSACYVYLQYLEHSDCPSRLLDKSYLYKSYEYRCNNSNFPEWPSSLFPNINDYIGVLLCTKREYICKYNALYNEKELSKINSFIVKAKE